MDVQMEDNGSASHEEKFRVYNDALVHAARAQSPNVRRTTAAATRSRLRCAVSQCDYLRDKIARKRESDRRELQEAKAKVQDKYEEWPVERRIAQVEADRQQVMQLIADIRAGKTRQPQMENGKYAIAYDDGEVEEDVPVPSNTSDDLAPDRPEQQQEEDIEMEEPQDFPSNAQENEEIEADEPAASEPERVFYSSKREPHHYVEPPQSARQNENDSETPSTEVSAERTYIIDSLELLEKRLGDAASAKSVLSTLVKHMRAYPQVTADLVHERGGERLIIDALKFHPLHAVIQCYGFVLLRRLCFLCVKSTHYLLRNGIVELVIQAMNAFGEDAILQASACGALAVFTRVHAGLNSLIEFQVAQLVLSTLIYHKTYSVHTRQVHYYGCEASIQKYSAAASKQIALCSVRQSPTKRIKDTATEILREAESLENAPMDKRPTKRSVPRRLTGTGKRKSKSTSGYGASRGATYSSSLSYRNPPKNSKISSQYGQPAGGDMNSFSYPVRDYSAPQQPSSLVILDGGFGVDSGFGSTNKRKQSKEDRQTELFEAYGVQGVPNGGRPYGTKRRQLRAHLASAESTWATPHQHLPSSIKPLSSRSNHLDHGAAQTTRGAMRKKKNPGGRTAFQVKVESDSQLLVSREAHASYPSPQRLGAATKRAAKARQKRILATNHSSLNARSNNTSSESLNDFAEKLHKMIDKAKSSLANGNTTSMPVDAVTRPQNSSAGSKTARKTREPSVKFSEDTRPKSKKASSTKQRTKDISTPREAIETRPAKPTLGVNKRPSSDAASVPVVSRPKPVVSRAVVTPKITFESKPRPVAKAVKAAPTKPADKPQDSVVETKPAEISPVIDTQRLMNHIKWKPTLMQLNLWRRQLHQSNNLLYQRKRNPRISEATSATVDAPLVAEEEAAPDIISDATVGNSNERSEDGQQSSEPLGENPSLASEPTEDQPGSAAVDAMYGDAFGEFDDNGGDDEEMAVEAEADTDDTQLPSTEVSDPQADVPLQDSKSGEALYDDGYDDFDEDNAPHKEEPEAGDNQDMEPLDTIASQPAEIAEEETPVAVAAAKEETAASAEQGGEGDNKSLHSVSVDERSDDVTDGDPDDAHADPEDVAADEKAGIDTPSDNAGEGAPDGGHVGNASEQAAEPSADIASSTSVVEPAETKGAVDAEPSAQPEDDSLIATPPNDPVVSIEPATDEATADPAQPQQDEEQSVDETTLSRKSPYRDNFDDDEAHHVAEPSEAVEVDPVAAPVEDTAKVTDQQQQEEDTPDNTEAVPEADTPADAASKDAAESVIPDAVVEPSESQQPENSESTSLQSWIAQEQVGDKTDVYNDDALEDNVDEVAPATENPVESSDPVPVSTESSAEPSAASEPPQSKADTEVAQEEAESPVTSAQPETYDDEEFDKGAEEEVAAPTAEESNLTPNDESKGKDLDIPASLEQPSGEAVDSADHTDEPIAVEETLPESEPQTSSHPEQSSSEDAANSPDAVDDSVSEGKIEPEVATETPSEDVGDEAESPTENEAKVDPATDTVDNSVLEMPPSESEPQAATSDEQPNDQDNSTSPGYKPAVSSDPENTANIDQAENVPEPEAQSDTPIEPEDKPDQSADYTQGDDAFDDETPESKPAPVDAIVDAGTSAEPMVDAAQEETQYEDADFDDAEKDTASENKPDSDASEEATPVNSASPDYPSTTQAEETESVKDDSQVPTSDTTKEEAVGLPATTQVDEGAVETSQAALDPIADAAEEGEEQPTSDVVAAEAEIKDEPPVSCSDATAYEEDFPDDVPLEANENTAAPTEKEAVDNDGTPVSTESPVIDPNVAPDESVDDTAQPAGSADAAPDSPNDERYDDGFDDENTAPAIDASDSRNAVDISSAEASQDNIVAGNEQPHQDEAANVELDTKSAENTAQDEADLKPEQCEAADAAEAKPIQEPVESEQVTSEIEPARPGTTEATPVESEAVSMESEAVESENIEPEAAIVDPGEPEAVEPETTEPEVAQTEAIDIGTVPETREAETVNAEAAESGTVDPIHETQTTASATEELTTVEPQATEPEVVEPEVISTQSTEPEAVESVAVGSEVTIQESTEERSITEPVLKEPAAPEANQDEPTSITEPVVSDGEDLTASETAVEPSPDTPTESNHQSLTEEEGAAIEATEDAAQGEEASTVEGATDPNQSEDPVEDTTIPSVDAPAVEIPVEVTLDEPQEPASPAEENASDAIVSADTVPLDDQEAITQSESTSEVVKEDTAEVRDEPVSYATSPAPAEPFAPSQEAQQDQEPDYTEADAPADEPPTIVPGESTPTAEVMKEESPKAPPEEPSEQEKEEISEAAEELATEAEPAQHEDVTVESTHAMPPAASETEDQYDEDEGYNEFDDQDIETTEDEYEEYENDDYGEEETAAETPRADPVATRIEPPVSAREQEIDEVVDAPADAEDAYADDQDEYNNEYEEEDASEVPKSSPPKEDKPTTQAEASADEYEDDNEEEYADDAIEDSSPLKPTPAAPGNKSDDEMEEELGYESDEGYADLEEVRTNNPDYYNQLLEFHAASKVEQTSSPDAPQRSPQQQAPVARDPRRPSPPRDPRARVQPPKTAAPPPQTRAEPPRASSVVSKSGAGDGSAAKSSNVAHLMQLLKRKQRAPSPPQPVQQEITNDPPRAPDAAAVMSILQKLKGMSNGASTRPAAPQVQPQIAPQPQQGEQAPPRSDNASRMWFSDKIVAHKDRVESNVQKLYAALPLVCRESGLRFREQAQLDAHLDFLFQYNRSRKERGKGGVSRSCSFFDRTQKENEKNAGEQASWENARVPVDETITRCRICGENFSRSWDEEEEDWMYTNAVAGTIHNTGPNGNEQQDTIFHKYCYDTVMANSKHVTPAHLIPAERDVAMKGDACSDDSMNGSGGVKRSLEEVYAVVWTERFVRWIIDTLCWYF
ncbi:Armadillo-type fold [Phytophthora cactorum]|nr:Armadillo-type fold [Phytophthora cactorum]